MESKEKQKTKETDVVKPYTIRILPDNEDIIDKGKWYHYAMDSKADKVIKSSEVDEHFESLRKDIIEKKREVPKILKINLDAHGRPDGSIFMGNDEATMCNNMYYTLGGHIRELLKMGVGRIYIKTSPCCGGCYFDKANEKKASSKK